jgi:formate/nitrite transporter FocA (FNT family)
VGNHVEQIYAKLGVSSRAAAAMRATQFGFVATATEPVMLANARPRMADRPPASRRGTHDEGTDLSSALARTVSEGEERLSRTWPGLVATGAIGGIDVGFGLFALLIVREATHSELLGALAFGFGFVALTLGNSELFTENFLVPVGALMAGRSSVGQLMRLWSVTLVLNLAGGWVLTALMMNGFPNLPRTAVEVGRHFDATGVGWESFSAAVLGGAIMTLMTWLERSTPSVLAKLVVAVWVAFILAAAPLNHVVVVSLEMFAALQAGAPFGYDGWLAIAAWYTLGNMIGGIVLVTGLRLVQVGVGRIADERAITEEEHGPRPDR